MYLEHKTMTWLHIDEVVKRLPSEAWKKIVGAWGRLDHQNI